MSDQQAATALTAAAVIATILVARAAVLHQSGRGHAARPAHRAAAAHPAPSRPLPTRFLTTPSALCERRNSTSTAAGNSSAHTPTRLSDPPAGAAPAEHKTARTRRGR